MKKIRLILALVMLLSLAMSSAAYAQDRGPNAPQTVSSWTVGPDPSRIVGTLTLTIGFSFTSADATTQFCIEGPANAGGSDALWYTAMPATITLLETQGFSSESVGFSKAALLATSQATCPGGTRVALYTGAHTTLATGSSIDANGTGSVTLITGTGATAGTGNWQFYAGEPTGAPGSLVYNHELIDPAIIYASDSPTCGGNGYAGISCFTSLDTALSEADLYDTATVSIVGNMTLDSNGSTIAAGASDPTLLNGLSSANVAPPGGCSDVLTVSNGATVQDMTVDGTNCTGAVGLKIDTAAGTVDNVTVQDFTTGIGISNTHSATVIQNGSIIQNNFVGIATSGTTIQGSTIQNNLDDGIQVVGSSSATIRDNDILTNLGDGVQVPAGYSGTIQENHIDGSGVYGINFTGTASGTPLIQWNNITSNGTRAFSNGSSSIFIGGNYMDDGAALADLGGFDGAVIGSPLTRNAGPGINAGNIYEATIPGNNGSNDYGDVVITNTTSGPLNFVVIDLSSDTPFGVGADPYQNTQCSDYFDVYIDEATALSTLITIRLDVTGGAACTDANAPVDDICSNVPSNRGTPVRFVNTDSSVWQPTSNKACSGGTGGGAVQTWASGQIAANALGGTGVVVMGSSSPTLIGLSSLTSSAARNTWIPVALAVFALVGVGAFTILRKKRQEQ